MIEHGSSVTVHATGTLRIGAKKFWSTHDSGAPAAFKIKKGAVIDGWVEGLVGQRDGAHLRLEIPAAKAYGARGKPPSIPADADLHFEIEILGVQ